MSPLSNIIHEKKEAVDLQAVEVMSLADNKNNHIIHTAIDVVKPVLVEFSKANYIEILKGYGLDPQRIDYHWQVGTINHVQGWILSISIIRSRILDALGVVLPYLLSEKVPFRIVQDYDTAVSVLDGNLGRDWIGKIIIVYPPSDGPAANLAKELISLTNIFKGPAVLTDILLGGCVYTRYGATGAIKKSDNAGRIQNYMYDVKGELVLDIPSIPFVSPGGRSWPFSEVASPVQPEPPKLLHNRYWIIEPLKSDPRGDVLKCLYLYNHFYPKMCVIKQGKKNMWSDEQGRDIPDRLIWQQEVYNILSGKVKMPKIFDLFKENGDTYLAMEHIKGQSVFDYVTKKLNPNCEFFGNLPAKSQTEIIGFLIKIAKIVKVIHENHLVHRDITPVNFFVDRDKDLVLLDNELAYSCTDIKPMPPFQFGTHGFMSLEQEAALEPTPREDIYGMGATMITLLTGLPPLTFDVAERKTLETSLRFFIQDSDTGTLIIDCLLGGSFKAIKSQDIEDVLSKRSRALPKNVVRRCSEKDATMINDVISKGLNGLISEPTVLQDGLWLTRSISYDPVTGKQGNGFNKSGGLFEGISGVLYTFAQAKLSGFDISRCMDSIQQNWNFLQARYLSEVAHLPPGLAGGAAGMAVAISRSMDAGMIEKNEQNLDVLMKCLNIPYCGFDLANGIAGQGIATIKCKNNLPDGFVSEQLAKYYKVLQGAQDKNGDWLKIRAGKSKPMGAILFEQGNTGINFFLLKYYLLVKDQSVWATINLLLRGLRKIHPFIKARYMKLGFREHLQDVQLRDGFKGMIQNYLFAYEITKDNIYKDFGQDLLICYPRNVVHEDLSLRQGIAGIGDLYLEAFHRLGNNEWGQRAAWIASVLMHTAHFGPSNNAYWITNNQTLTTADYMTGNGGIICFLLRYYNYLQNI